ncbi:unnamed protein product [Calypogeia fissa]
MATIKYSVILKACPAMRQSGLMALYHHPFSLTAGFSFVVGYKDFYDPSLLNTEPFYVLQNQTWSANAMEPSSIFFQPYPAQCLSTQLIQRDRVATTLRRLA